MTAIGPKAFASAKKQLKKVEIGKNVRVIGKAAFAGCAKLKQVKGGKSIATIGAKAFKGAKKLKSITITSKMLSKKGVKGSLKGSSIKLLKVKVGSAKANKRFVKKYRKAFTRSNCGRAVRVK